MVTQLIVPFYSEATGWTVTIDGVSYRPARVTPSGFVRDAPGFDSVIRELYNAVVATHSLTIRWTYVVPAGRIALVDNIAALTEATTTKSQVSAGIDVQDVVPVQVGLPLVLRSNTTEDRVFNVAPFFLMEAGETLRSFTQNDDTVARQIVVSASIREYVI